MKIVTKTNIKEYPLLFRGKVRDIYEIDAHSLLIVTTDRMSAFDVVMNEPIPYKGVILNKITLFWMDKFEGLIPNHLLAIRPKDFPKKLAPHAENLEGRAVIVRRTEPLPIECIVRGFITGSGWRDYQNTGQVCGHSLPKNLLESQKLPEALFTPSTKAKLGEHDENITLKQAKQKVGDELLARVRDISLDIYTLARNFAEKKDILIADTKFEFGLAGQELLLIDEVLTPDSSRFWPKNGYAPGKTQPSFDKQYLRDWLGGLGWDKNPPPPALPPKIVEQTQARYMEAYESLTGEKFTIA
ncbi:MAG: phosphoribosylaminoimidazolesuccinocarboxamide synthase [Thermodesulfobacteriota bacterium]|nr:phosphoribosylaminoimidazolesuccinocarboxamide synthase [Thermodesulfobacteriota bacterium]